MNGVVDRGVYEFQKAFVDAIIEKAFLWDEKISTMSSAWLRFAARIAPAVEKMTASAEPVLPVTDADLIRMTDDEVDMPEERSLDQDASTGGMCAVGDSERSHFPVAQPANTHSEHGVVVSPCAAVPQSPADTDGERDVAVPVPFSTHTAPPPANADWGDKAATSPTQIPLLSHTSQLPADDDEDAAVAPKTASTDVHAEPATSTVQFSNTEAVNVDASADGEGVSASKVTAFTVEETQVPEDPFDPKDLSDIDDSEEESGSSLPLSSVIEGKGKGVSRIRGPRRLHRSAVTAMESSTSRRSERLLSRPSGKNTRSKRPLSSSSEHEDPASGTACASKGGGSKSLAKRQRRHSPKRKREAPMITAFPVNPPTAEGAEMKYADLLEPSTESASKRGEGEVMELDLPPPGPREVMKLDLPTAVYNDVTGQVDIELRPFLFPYQAKVCSCHLSLYRPNYRANTHFTLLDRWTAMGSRFARKIR